MTSIPHSGSVWMMRLFGVPKFVKSEIIVTFSLFAVRVKILLLHQQVVKYFVFMRIICTQKNKTTSGVQKAFRALGLGVAATALHSGSSD